MAAVTAYNPIDPSFSEWYKSLQESAVEDPEEAITELMRVSERVSTAVSSQLVFLRSLAGEIRSRDPHEYFTSSNYFLTPRGAAVITNELLKKTGRFIGIDAVDGTIQLADVIERFIDSSKNSLALFIRDIDSSHIIPVLLEKKETLYTVLIMDSMGKVCPYSNRVIEAIAEKISLFIPLENVTIFAFDDCRQYDCFSCGAFSVSDIIEAVSTDYMKSLTSTEDGPSASSSSSHLHTETHSFPMSSKDPASGFSLRKEHEFPVTHISGLPFHFGKLTQSISRLESEYASHPELSTFAAQYFRESHTMSTEPKVVRNMYANDLLRECFSRALVLMIEEGRACSEEALHSYLRSKLPDLALASVFSEEDVVAASEEPAA